MISKNSVQLVLDDISSLEEEMRTRVQLVAVSKYVDHSRMATVIDQGITHFGENRIQDAIPKIEWLNQKASNLTWHLIGHLQTNKVKKAVQYFDWIQSIDSLRLLEKIDATAQDLNKTIQGLIQINIGEESQKNGFSLAEFQRLKNQFFKFRSVRIRGLMAILPLCETDEKSAIYFEKMSQLYEVFKEQSPFVDTLSMGMSQDYQLAIRKGATMVRVGSKLWQS